MTVQDAISQLQEIADGKLIPPILVPAIKEIIKTLTETLR